MPRPDWPTAAPFIPATTSLAGLASAMDGCRGCPLWEPATRAVPGAGPADARVVLVGEQPGDQEDLAGKPFVGPAGRLLDEVLGVVGIDRRRAYVTNAVKHFKFEQRGARRIHSKPNAAEIKICNTWLREELEAIGPSIVVCLGATAAQSLLGPTFRITRSRGAFFETPFAPKLIATYHPSALLRMPDEAARERARGEFEGDLRKVAGALAQLKSP